MAGEVIVDALPYIDQGYDEPGVREAVRIVITLKEVMFRLGAVGCNVLECFPPFSDIIMLNAVF